MEEQMTGVKDLGKYSWKDPGLWNEAGFHLNHRSTTHWFWSKFIHSDCFLICKKVIIAAHNIVTRIK